MSDKIELGQLGDWRRTIYCGEARVDHVDKELILMGWVHSVRDHGGLIFIDLRDKSGLVQLVFDPSHEQDCHV